jgi:UDP-N-acetylglucosamine 2-epimerase (non-hydrolysing)
MILPIDRRKKILTLFGTRSEIIKLALVLHRLDREPGQLETCNVLSGQQGELTAPFLQVFGIRVDENLGVEQNGRSPNALCARLLTVLDPVLTREQPELVMVLGDSTTALAGALAAFHRRLPIAHVEAGLRSESLLNPFPEEMNRRLISRLATYHFAPTPLNRRNLLAEGIEERHIFLTGNPGVEALQHMVRTGICSPHTLSLINLTRHCRRLVLTTHRPEGQGRIRREHLRVFRHFVEQHSDVALIFPVPPDPEVRQAGRDELGGHERIFLCDPLPYEDFVSLLQHAWIIASDSSGVQEEAPSLGVPLLLLREHTDRPEAIHSGAAKLAGGDAARLRSLLEETYGDPEWSRRLQSIPNPFGAGDSARRIGHIVTGLVA